MNLFVRCLDTNDREVEHLLDFINITSKLTKNGFVIYPKFLIKKSSDLMIRGGDFYSVWIEEKNLWSTDENDAIRLIDHMLDQYYEENKERLEEKAAAYNIPKNCIISHLWDAESGMIDRWHKYCQRQLRDNYHSLNDRLVFSNTETKKEDYSSQSLPYPLLRGDISAYDRMMSVLYSEEERKKIEWAIGSIVSGDSVNIQKFMVFYGEAGTGKSTVINIIQKLFQGYYCTFDSKALGSANATFALEPFKANPLVAIQHDGD